MDIKPRSAIGKLARWCLWRTGFEFEFIHRAVVRHEVAEKLSQVPTTCTYNEDLYDETPVFAVWHHTRKKKMPAAFGCQDCDNLQNLFQQRPTMTATFGDVKLPTTSEFIRTRNKGTFCKENETTFWNIKFSFFFWAEYTPLIHAAFDGSLQRLVLLSLRPTILYWVHHSTSVGHPNPNKCVMYYFLRRDFYWPNLIVDVYNTVLFCLHSPWMGTLFRHEHKFELFRATSALKFVLIYILGEIQRTASDNHLMVIISERYSKLTRAIPTTKITSTQVANIFFTNWIISHYFLITSY